MSTILIGDDVSANRDVLVTLLADKGHTVIEAADGDEGLDGWNADPSLFHPCSCCRSRESVNLDRRIVTT